MKLKILDPGHFHAALLQKTMVSDIDPTVHVYAPDGPEVRDYLQRIDAFATRADNPARWRLAPYLGADYLERFIADQADDAAGGVVVIAGNNRRKAEYLSRAVAAGVHVLADKPMAIDAEGFESLQKAFATADAGTVLLYDIMTERHEITTVLQKEFSTMPPVFGELATGSEQAPAVIKESVHHFAKQVSGSPIQRPAWFFDIAQQGEGIVDVTTHLVDLVQWECFPGEIIDYRKDIRIVSARRWPTAITPAQFEQVTLCQRFPDFLQKDVQSGGNLHVYANGEIDYCIKGVHARVSAVWNFEAPTGGGDTHFSILHGTRSNLVIRQGEAQLWQPVLSIEPNESTDTAAFESALKRALQRVQERYPGVAIERSDRGWDVVVPAAYHIGHEAHFGQVAAQFLGYIERGSLPDWEVPNMLAKYYTTTAAREKAWAA